MSIEARTLALGHLAGDLIIASGRPGWADEESAALADELVALDRCAEVAAGIGFYLSMVRAKALTLVAEPLDRSDLGRAIQRRNDLGDLIIVVERALDLLDRVHDAGELAEASRLVAHHTAKILEARP